ncbi:META domain-containing protein [Streptomyces formicae]|uniref:META domain-containing protein n=1 Tax=Streptomyces formicae TaxID=1616117 RepID=A0ABY3WWP2_9ACTN|nr:META domain-containing protein [Streptomyces formicae]UNM16065.1 META domain-containing protein [Streptomyces formicae]
MRTKLIVPAAAAVTAVLTLTACGTESGAGSGSAGGSVGPVLPVTGVHWSVDSVTVDGKKTAAPENAHFEIDTKGRASGNYGCNHFGADVSVEGDTITVGQGQMTEMGCPEELAAFEKAMSKAFTGKLKAKLTDGNLTLTATNGDSIALTKENAAPLVGTEWTVTSLVTGDTAASLPAGTEKKAHFVLGKDGSVRGSLGCNTFTGTATVAEATGTITFGRLATTRRMCAGPEMTLERQMTQVLQGTVAYEVRHRGLSLTADGGQGLAAAAS